MLTGRVGSDRFESRHVLSPCRSRRNWRGEDYRKLRSGEKLYSKQASSKWNVKWIWCCKAVLAWLWTAGTLVRKCKVFGQENVPNLVLIDGLRNRYLRRNWSPKARATQMLSTLMLWRTNTSRRCLLAISSLPRSDYAPSSPARTNCYNVPRSIFAHILIMMFKETSFASEAVSLLSMHGLREFSWRWNFFAQDKKISTPDLRGTILPGITRKSIIELAQTLGYEVHCATTAVNLRIDLQLEYLKNSKLVVLLHKKYM